MRLSPHSVCQHTQMHKQNNKMKPEGFQIPLLHNESTAVFPELKIFPQATMLTESFLYSLPFYYYLKILLLLPHSFSTC